MGPIKVAVLDDYQARAGPIFDKLDAATFQVEVFTDTLLPYNHPNTKQETKDQLAKRLEPFNVICTLLKYNGRQRFVCHADPSISHIGTMRERTPFPADLIRRLPNLKLVLTTGLRNASLDLDAFKQHSIPVVGVVDKSEGRSGPDSTTQHCVALTLAAARNVAQDDLSIKTGGWQTGYATGLSGKVFGTVGLGRLGLSVSKIMHLAFGMRVIAWSPNLTQDVADEKAKTAGFPVERSDGEKTFKVVGREELFRTADVVNIHVVLSDRSRGLIGRQELEMMKPSSIFVNTSRGPIVVEEDLLSVLDKGKIRAAALDVFEIEPLPLDSPWRTTKWGHDGRSEVLLSPHMGYVEESTMEKWYALQVEAIQNWQRGGELLNRMA